MYCYVLKLLCSNHPVVFPKSSSDVHLLRRPCSNMLCLMYITCTFCTYYKHMYVHQRFAVIGIETFDLSVLTSPISFFQKDLMSNAWYNVTLLKKLSFTTHYTKVITK